MNAQDGDKCVDWDLDMDTLMKTSFDVEDMGLGTEVPILIDMNVL